MTGSISFIVPTYNEFQSLEICIESIVSYASSRDLEYEIIVIDSGSTDGTVETLKTIASRCESVRAVFQEQRLGMGSALREAYEYVRCTYVCHYECDMPFDLTELDKALGLLEDRQCDFVLGDRKGGRDRLIRYLYTSGYRWFLRLFFGSKFQTINYSYKIFNSSILSCIRLKSAGWFIDAELVLEVLRTGFAIREIPVPYIERDRGASTVRLKDIFHIISEAGCYARERWSFFSPSSS